MPADDGRRPPPTPPVATRAPQGTPPSGVTAGDAQSAFRHGARLVECHDADGREPLEHGPALQQQATTRGGRQRRDHRDGCRDDERARTRHDEQHERALDPGDPRCPREQRRHEGHRRGKPQHDRRVDGRETIDGRLHLRARRVRPLHLVHDARHRRVARHTTHCDCQQRLAIHGTGIDRVSRHLQHGLGLTGHRRLIDGALARCDDAVEGHAAAGTHRDDLADGDLRDGHRARGSAPGSRSAVGGVTSSTSAMARRARARLRASSACATPNSTSTVAASNHSSMASAPATATVISTWMSSRRPRAACQARCSVPGAVSATASNSAARTQMSRTSSSQRAPAATHASPATNERPGHAGLDAGRVAARGDRPGAHARLRDRLGDAGRRERGAVVVDTELPRQHVGVERDHAVERAQTLLEDRDFVGAVHFGDVERRGAMVGAARDRQARSSLLVPPCGSCT